MPAVMAEITGKVQVSVEPRRGLAGPLALWLAVQGGALLLAGLPTPLSDKFTRPAERRAIEEMLVVQITFSAMLFPIILNGLWRMLAAMATVWPMLALAGVLSVRPTGDVVRGATYVSLWIGLLAGWGWVLPGRRSRVIGCAVATGISAGSALLAYLAVEFDVSASTSWNNLGFSGPVIGVLQATAAWNWPLWRELAYLIVLSVIAIGTIKGAHRLRR